MRDNQGKRLALADRRATELALKHPQLMDDNQLEPIKAERKRGGGMAGLARVVGGRKKKVEESESDEELEGGAKHGKKFARHLLENNGKEFVEQFLKGYHSAMKGGSDGLIMDNKTKARMGRMKQTGGALPPAGLEVEHALMSPAKVGLPGASLGGQDVPPNGLAPVAYGSAPQAPASFKRNTVGLGAQYPLPSAQVGTGRKKKAVVIEEATVVKGGARAQRGAAISKLMKEKGMTLGEASRYLKEHK